MRGGINMRTRRLILLVIALILSVTVSSVPAAASSSAGGASLSRSSAGTAAAGLNVNPRLAAGTIAIILLLVFVIAFMSVSTMLRERAEAQLLRLATVVEQAAEGIAITDPNGVVTYVNPAFGAATGFPGKEGIGHDIRPILGLNAKTPLSSSVSQKLKLGDSWKGRVSTTRKDGSPLEMEFMISPIRNPAGAVVNYAFVGSDVTEETALEEQLRQSQKLEAVGMLAGGVAHDFNNILTGILGYANMLEPDAQPGSTMQEGLHVIQQAAERAAELTKQLLGFARRGRSQNTTVDLNSTILEVVSLLTRTVEKNIAITEYFDSDQATVLGDPGQLQQVVLNLAINARDAMPHGGRMTIRTRRMDLNADQLTGHPGAAPGTFVVLSVSDTGIGIEKKNLRRIFEPFFTTKEAGKGTGMGLAMVYGIVKAHKGFIDVESKVGSGTTFTVYIPATDTVPVNVPVAGTHTAGHGLILVVDDEEVVRKLTYEILHRAGYEVVTAAGTNDAVAWYRSHPSGADLAIIDMVMPGLDGLECFRELKKVSPEIRAILSTGYGLDGHAQEALDAGMVGYVQKPYHTQDLIGAVADALATAGASADPEHSSRH